MRGTFCLALICMCMTATAQYTTIDTTLAGNIKARITYYKGLDSVEAFFVIHGVGSVGSDTALIADAGPHFWMRNSAWDGSVQLDNGVHYPAYITLQMPIKWVQPKFLRPAVNAVLKRLPQIKRYGRHAMGLSMGAWEWEMYSTFKADSTDYSSFTTFQSITSIQGVTTRGVNYGATIPAPERYGHWVAYSRRKTGYGSYLGFEQVKDGRKIWERTSNINDSVPGAAHLIWTNFCDEGDCGKHHSFNRYYNPAENNWTPTHLLLVDSQVDGGKRYFSQWLKPGINIYQWALLQGDTTLPKPKGTK